MAGYTTNPLFTRATRRLRDSARQTFRKSEFGRLLREFEKAHQKPLAGPKDLGKLVHALERHGPRELLRELSRSDAGRLARDLERYARRGGVGRKLVDQVLSALGPAGGLIKALSGVMSGPAKSSSRQRSMAAAIGFIQSFGNEVLRNPRTATPEQIAEDIEKARAYLELVKAVPVPSVPAKAETLAPRPGRKTVDVTMTSGITRRFALTHPIVTGEMVPAHSSNVHSFGYDVSRWLLYVRFLAPDRSGHGDKSGPGPIYQYSEVPPEVFLAFLRASSKGNFVWDKLRIRGTVSGHRFDYRLVGITQDYVPRKATLTPRGEEFLGRTIRTNQGRGLSSSLPNQLVRPLTFVGSNGTPNRGRPKPPNRGRPNRGAQG